MKLKITCPQCGKTYKVEADDFKECAFAKCSECGSLIPVETPAAPPVQTERDDLQRVHVVKLELPTVTVEWAFVVLWRFSLAFFLLALIPCVVWLIVLYIIRATE